MKQENKWKMDVGNQWRMRDMALRTPQNINTGVMDKSLVRQDPVFALFNAHVRSLCAGGKFF